ncbi:MAG: PilT/PilU family type 4a pilus ATPase [Oscillospiraceae bacterium]|nr:PilT/PilU family type 4a pilus ATPase [Oscillospiraceae bacterium]
MDFLSIIKEAVFRGASDIFLIAGQPVAYKCRREIHDIAGAPLSGDEAEKVIDQIYAMSGRSPKRYHETWDDDFAVTMAGMRFRVSALRQRGCCAAVIRPVASGIPDYVRLGIPECVMDTAHLQKGLVLVTGPAGSGKSTTLACVMDRVNHNYSKHIITIEDPIEFIYENDRCIFTQREVGTDTAGYAAALRASLRQSPDVILVGEMRDYDTIKTALTAAETGHLIFSTLHTVGIGSTVNRIIDIFPPDQQQQIRVQLASQLCTVVTQELVRTVDGALAPVFEVVQVNSALRNMIRENKTYQLDSSLGMYSGDGILSLDGGLHDLYKAGRITLDTALSAALRPDVLRKRIEGGIDIPQLK